MTALASHGLAADLPVGWSGEIYLRPPAAPAGPGGSRAAATMTSPILHAASFSLPPERGDFGGGAVELMSAGDAFFVLFEHERAAASKALFSTHGLPGALTSADFHPQTLQRPYAHQVGCQRFFNTHGRAFCLYVVLGNLQQAPASLAPVNGLLRSLRVT